MPEPSRLSRRELLASGGVAAALAIAGCGSSRSVAGRPSSALTPDAAAPSRIAYCTLFNKGRWSGPRNADGSPSLSIVDAILTRHAGEATPMYMRMTSAAPSGTELPAHGSEELRVAQRLAHAGIRLGVAVDTYPRGGTRRTAGDIIDQGRQIRTASDAAGGVYDWIFLDHAQNRTPAGGKGLDDLQQIIDALAADGWSRVMINASGFNDHHLSDLPRRTWAMARHFQLLGGDWRSNVARAVATHRGAVTPSDLDFVDYVARERHGTTAILKLEIPSETQRFRLLSVADQLTLLTLWAQEGPRRGYRMIYPLFVAGDPLGDRRTEYDSLAVGTFSEQRSLMQRDG